MDADDISEAVVYILSAKPHVQVVTHAYESAINSTNKKPKTC